MPLIRQEFIRRDDLRQNRDRLYVFGDNYAQSGAGGQARECRGEPNAVGIPTKRTPSMDAAAFLTNEDLDEWRRRSFPAFNRLENALACGWTVVVPSDGVGTGLARLAQFAPAIDAEIKGRFDDLAQRYPLPATLPRSGA